MKHRRPSTVDGALKTDRYDRRVFADIYEDASALPETAQQLEIPTAKQLMQDVWAGLFKPQPFLKEDIMPDLQLNKVIMEQAMKLPEWTALRDGTVLDQWAAALGSVAIGEKCKELIPEDTKKQMEEAQQKQQEANQMQGMADAMEMQNQLDGQESQEIQDQIAQLQQQASQMMAEAQQLAEDAVKSLGKRQLKKALREAVNDAQDANEKAEVFSWGTNPGQQTMVEAKEKFELALQLRNNPRLKDIAKLAGKMKRLALSKQRTKVNQVPSEIVDIETGSDLSRILPVELGSLRHPIREKDFKRRYLEGKLAQYKMRGRETEGRGPIVVCIDSSGSMSGQREIWSKAVLLALFQVAGRQKRAFCCIHFGYSSEIKRFVFKNPRKTTPAEIAEMAAFFFAGGTDFEAPLKEAVEVIEQSAFNKADMIFITDGECAVSNSFLKEFRKIKEQREFSVISVIIEGSSYSVKEFSDKVAHVVPGKDDAEALDLMFSI